MSRPAPALPVSSSWSVGGDGVKQTRRKAARPTLRPRACGFCGERTHDKRQCPSVDARLTRIREGVQFIKTQKNPFEWERLAVAKEALSFIAKLPTERESRRTKVSRQEREQVIEAARLALVAWNWGKQ